MATATIPRGTTKAAAPPDDAIAIDPAFGVVASVALDLIDVGDNVRLDIADVDELAASIAEHGVLQPVKVRPVGGRFVLVWGQRRVLASRKAGLERIPAIIETSSSTAGAELAVEQLVENLHRADLNPIDRAAAMRAVVNSGVSQADLAKMLGLGASTIANDLGLLDAPSQIRELVQKGELSPAHAKAIKGLAPKTQVELARDVIKRGLSAHATEAEVQERKRQADQEREQRERQTEDRKRQREQLVASIGEFETKKVAKDALIVVTNGDGYYGQGNAKAEEVAELIASAGYTNVRAAKTYNEIQPRPTGKTCDCTAWKAAEHTSYDYSKRVDGYYAQSSRVSITKGCIDRKHESAKAEADEKARRAKYALEEKVRQRVRRDALGVVVPATSTDTPLLIGVPRILAEAALWSILGYNSAGWATRRGGAHSNPWPTFHGLSDEDLASELAKAIAEDFRDHSGYHVDWPTLAAELGLADAPAAPATPREPKVGEVLVGFDAKKYRIRDVAPHALHLAEAGPSWKRTAIVALAEPSRVEWDAETAVWRAPVVPAETPA